MSEKNKTVTEDPVSMVDLLNEDENFDADALLADLDKESNTRIYSGKVSKWIVRIVLLAIVGFIFYCIFGYIEERARKSIFLGLIMVAGFLLYPSHKNQSVHLSRIRIPDAILAIVSFFPYLYFALNVEYFINSATRTTSFDVIVGLIAIVLLFELCRRVTGIPIMVVAGAFIVYMGYNCIFERGFDFFKAINRITNQLFYSNVSIMGSPINVCVNFIVLFILFGSFLEKSGIGTFFIDLANSIAGFSAGGPAKVAVISSGLEGMYSGSSVANTVGSGSVTIPVMKKAGYRPEFAAAVEAAASTGGQIMPPIMGAAAFLMAEMTDTPYQVIATAAILPAILYFAGIFLMVHFEAKKMGLKGLPKDSIPNFFKLMLKKGYLLIPIVLLVGLMSSGRTASFAASIAIVAAIVVSFFDKETRFTPSRFINTIEAGAKNAIGVSVACAMAGIVIGVITYTGLATTLFNVIVPIAKQNIFIALFLTMIACIICGMGVPTTANYILMATITAPIVIGMGIEPLAAHMFVFFFGIVADITPPVALAAYAGSAIAHSNPLKTGVQATKLAITAFIVPYVFALSPEMLWIGIEANASDIWMVVRICLTSAAGMVALSAGLEGFLLTHLKIWERIPLIIAGVLMVIPSGITDVIGIAIFAVIIVFEIIRKNASKKNEIPA
jgi:TRAP transporter 4TM/12TM fusion protein